MAIVVSLRMTFLEYKTNTKKLNFIPTDCLKESFLSLFFLSLKIMQSSVFNHHSSMQLIDILQNRKVLQIIP